MYMNSVYVHGIYVRGMYVNGIDVPREYVHRILQLYVSINY